jgi:predicted acyl esterase
MKFTLRLPVVVLSLLVCAELTSLAETKPFEVKCADFRLTGEPDDYPSVKRREDVLVYSAVPVTHATEVCGPLDVKLYAASSAPDTDWTV